MIRVHLKIHGKVQGVFFRDHTCRKAKEIGDITGWVANNADGTVDVVAEGPENKINDLIDWCHSGPSVANVEKVDAEKLTYTGEFDSFDIRY
jgi:acylphosphatase